MMKTKNRVVALLCCAALLCALAGCQLAREGRDDRGSREGKGTNALEDRLIGVFVSTEYLDLFDMDGYISDNAKDLSGGESIIDGDTQQYQDRLYATLKTETLTSDTGEKVESEDYVFEHIPGVPFFAPTLQDENGEDYTATMSDDAISDRRVDINLDEDTNSKILEGTLYVVPGRDDAFYLNPVYQSDDGSVYLTSGDGSSVSGARVEGERMLQTMEDTYTVTENGKPKTESFSISIAINAMFAPEDIAVLQMDADSNLIARAKYAPGAVPSELTPETRTAYIIVETYKTDAEGKQRIAREIYGDDAESMETYYARDDGVCVRHETQIKWQGKSDNTAE
jgi:hypothetical protein